MASVASERAAGTAAGVSGEFHSSSWLQLAAGIALRRGIERRRLYFIGESGADHLGEPLGFVLPVSFAHEFALAAVLLGTLAGALVGATMYVPTSPAKIAVGLVAGFAAGVVFGFGAGFLAVSARIGAYLNASRAGALWLKIELDPADGEEGRRQAERAEAILREARAESVRRVDGTRVINSPQSADFVA
jgi:hypothetical protein